jgi:GT2 family glycosyltransferase
VNISVIVTNWNGISLLKKYFEKVVIASSEAGEIIFTDDASEDDSVSFIRTLQKKYPQIKIISHRNNQGFGKNSNDAVKKASGELVVLLNSDIDPHPGYITNCLHHFNDPKVFGVGFSEYKHENYGKVFWKNGYIQIEPGFSLKTHISAWLSGGSSIIRRSEFLRLGGFDEVYQPFYFEDLDLGLRAWRSGYKLLWEPTAIVEHKHESTMSKKPKILLTYVKERNHLICVRRNITDPGLLRQNSFFSFLRVFYGPNYIKIILAAFRQLKKYPAPICPQKLTDKEVLKLFKK